MEDPKLKALSVKHVTLDTFRGYNHNLRIGDGQFYEMHNMTSDHYPVLSNRAQRSFCRQIIRPRGMIAKEALCYVDGPTLYVGDVAVSDLQLQTACDTCPLGQVCASYVPGKNNCQKQLVSMGPYVVILPDRVWVHTKKTDPQTGQYVFGHMENIWSSGGKTVTMHMCQADGTSYGVIARAQPEVPTDKQLWLDNTVTPYVLRQWSENAEAWLTISPTYVRLECLEENLAEGFQAFDGVELQGFADVNYAYIPDRSVIWSKTDNTIVVEGILQGNMKTTLPVTIRRTVPEMDYVIACGNRLWGCRYGPDSTGTFVNQIYCSKQGDFNNWDCRMGEESDSGVLPVGSDGPFTGAIAHLDHPVFFKENMLHKVYMDQKGSHTVTDTPCRGVQRGCSKSLAIVGEDVYYKAKDGICVYDGALPVSISADLGPDRYTDAVAGAHGGKYYISMARSGQRSLFVYDTARKLWHRHDDMDISQFCAHDQDLFVLCGTELVEILGNYPPTEGALRWHVQTGDDFFNLPEGGYLSQLTVVMDMTQGAKVSFLVCYDASGQWEHISTVSDDKKRIFHIPLQPRKCNAVALRIEGEGDVKIYSLTKTLRKGGDEK